MLGSFSWTRQPKRRTIVNRPRLWVEQLEARDCPSSVPPTLGVGQPVDTSPPPIITMSLAYDSISTVTLSGSVNDAEPAGETVTFTGLINGSATTDANGNFGYTSSFTGVGGIDATSIDAWGQTSNIAEVDVTASTLSLNAQVLPGHQVEFTGNASGIEGPVQRSRSAAPSTAALPPMPTAISPSPPTAPISARFRPSPLIRGRTRLRRQPARSRSLPQASP